MRMRRLIVAAVLGLTVVLLAGVVAFASARGEPAPNPGRQTVPAPIDARSGRYSVSRAAAV